MSARSAIAVAIVLTGCAGGAGGAGGKDGLPDGFGPSPLPGDEPVPEFALVDINPASSRSGEPVSPSDYLDQVSAWYFGHST